MKKLLLVLCFVFLVGLSQAQTKFSIFGGFGISDFGRESFTQTNDDVDQAAFIPVGAQLTFGTGSFRFGGEFHYAIVPFTHELTVNTTKIGELKTNQMYIGGLAKILLGGLSLKPYLRGGVGLYMGDMEFEVDEQFQNSLNNATTELKNAVGFNVGAGIDFKFRNGGTLFIEAVYHLVKREPDVTGVTVEAEPFNNYNLQIGYRF